MNKDRKSVEIYTDGSCLGNPGPGGYGAILRYRGQEKELSAGFPETTNNRMEILAAVKALEALREPCRVTLYSDSQYLVNAVNLGWLQKWRQNGWKRNKTEEAKNIDLWEQLVSLLAKHEVTFVWVKGHAENEFNNRCDELAVAAAKTAAKNEE